MLTPPRSLCGGGIKPSVSRGDCIPCNSIGERRRKVVLRHRLAFWEKSPPVQRRARGASTPSPSMMEPDMQLLFDVDTALPDITFDFTFDTPLPPPVPVFKGHGDSSMLPEPAASTGFAALPLDDSSSQRSARRAPPSPLSNGTSEDDQGAPSSATKVLLCCALAACEEALWLSRLRGCCVGAVLDRAFCSNAHERHLTGQDWEETAPAPTTEEENLACRRRGRRRRGRRDS
jgi:hypothetical protein